MTLNTSLRLALLTASLSSAVAFAQPANDACTGALNLDGSGGFPVVTPLQYVFTAAATSESPFSCAATTNVSLWYRFTPATSGTYLFSTCGTSATLDTVLAVYTGGCGSLVEVASGCSDDACGTRSFVNVPLTAGTTYFVQVAKKGATLPTILDTMQLTVGLSQPANDTCAAPNTLSLDAPQRVSITTTTTNDAQTGGGNACFLGVGQSSSTTTNPAPGRDSVFSFTPPSSGNYGFRVRTLHNNTLSSDVVAYLSDSCVSPMTPPQIYAPPQCIAASNRITSSSASVEEISCVPLTAGVPVFLWSDEGATPTTPTLYEVEVNACFPETEPNDTPAAANVLSCPSTGAISPAGEADFYSLGTLTAGSTIFAMVDGLAGGNAGSGTTDFDLRITTTTDTLEYDDLNADTAFGSLSAITVGTPAVGGAQHFVRVNHFSSTTAAGNYRVYATVQPGAPAAEIEPNDTIASATQNPSNFFSGDVTATTDVDLFGFEAQAGDLLFIGLDSAPNKTVSPTTGNHVLTLLDDGGNVLVSVNDASTTGSITTGAGSLTSSTPSFPGEALVYRATRTGKYHVRVGRTSTTGTGTYLLSITFNCLRSIGVPSITAVTPNTGSIVGNTSVTIDGTNFGATSTVFFGTQAAQVTARSATQLTVNTPPGTVGPVDVKVVNPGNQVGVATGAFTYFEPVIPPTVTSVAPFFGPTAGGTTVTINGSLFKTGAEVYFTVGTTTVAATNVVVANAIRLTCTTPAQAAGLATVTVRNPVDALEGSLNNAFEFLAPPTVGAVTPNSGLTGGGYPVTITGTGLRPGAQVRFGATLGSGVVVDPSGNSLTVNVPASATNSVVNVTVTNPDGQAATLTGGFTYLYPAPSIANVAPQSGFASGGTALTINGNNFIAGATVTIGGTPATNVAFVNSTRITCTTPPGVGGPANVVVTNVDAQSATLTGGFTYVPAPTVTGITPNHGPVQGGTLVTVTGTGFVPGASISIGGVPAFAVTVESATRATAITNAAPAGVADLVLTNPDTQRGTLTMAYTFDPAPTLVSASPISGTSAGGTRVTLTGTGFLPGATVLFGLDASPAVTVVSSTEVTAETPAHAAGVVSITLRNTDNQFADLARAFRFVDPPTLTAVAPNTGDVAGGTLITLTGTGFAPGSTVTLDGVAATGVAYVSTTQLTAYTPAHAPGMVDVVVTSDGVPATLTYGFTYTRGAPSISSVAPVSGPVEGGTLLTLTGSGFATGAVIKIGGVDATDVVVVSPVLARAVVPAHAAGRVDVVFTNDDMQAATLPMGFTYVTAPTGNTGTVTDGGSGAIGTEPVGGGGGQGGVSCGCTTADPATLTFLGMGLVLALARRRKTR